MLPLGCSQADPVPADELRRPSGSTHPIKFLPLLQNFWPFSKILTGGRDSLTIARMDTPDSVKMICPYCGGECVLEWSADAGLTAEPVVSVLASGVVREFVPTGGWGAHG